MAELIITEKPKSAQKIAHALSDGKAKKRADKGVPYYEFDLDGKTIYVASTVGHIYSLDEREKDKARPFPVFDIEWKPSHMLSKSADYTKKYADVLSKLSKICDEFTVATDYDIEGEVIGYNIVRFIANKPDANRMHFSTLTTDELKQAYVDKAVHIDWPQALAGETRHVLDWYYGINLSRALSSAIKKGGIFKILSTGRVQAPALKIVSDKEREIRAFVPEDYWEIEAQFVSFSAKHERDRFGKEDEAKAVYDKVSSSKQGIVRERDAKEKKVPPPNPFDLTSLQTDAYSLFKIKPAQALEVAQDLYTSGLISYPRTSSQQYPESIGYRKILKDLSKSGAYAKHTQFLLSQKALKPNNGKKTDPAHPAIYPTGQIASLEGRSQKIYDLIVKRFLATFGDDAVRENLTVTISIEDERFKAKGATTKVQGWFELYAPYARFKDEELPLLAIDERVPIKKIEMLAKQTQPPRRYTPASLIKELEKRNLGTKATRAAIIETLYDRGYLKGESIEVTDLGLKTIVILDKYLPQITDEALTQSFEEEMERIREDRKVQDAILTRARGVLVDVLGSFADKEKEVGKDLVEALKSEEQKGTIFGACPECSSQGRSGGEIVLKKGKFGRFLACSNYPECTVTINVPNTGILRPAQKACPACAYPVVEVGKTKRNAQEICVNQSCPTKQTVSEPAQEKECPKCKKGVMKLRNSVYGQFYGCSQYPKCKHTEKI